MLSSSSFHSWTNSFLTFPYVTFYWIKKIIISLTTPSVVCDNTTDVLSSLNKITEELFTWLLTNKWKQIMIMPSTLELTWGRWYSIADVANKSSTSKKLLGVTTYNKLKLDKHLENICQRASRKLNNLARLVNYMGLPKRRILMNAFFNALLFGCFTVTHLTAKLTGYMSVV